MAYNPQEYWQSRGQNYSVSDDTADEVDNLTQLVRNYVQDSDTILDVGSGYGRIYQHLVQNRIPREKFTLCDFVESMRYRHETFTGVLPDPWDGRTLPYDDSSFDFVISFSVMLHVPPADIINFWKEHVRVSGKYLYVATYAGGLDRIADHCFNHAYDDFIYAFGLQVVDKKMFRDGLRVNWLLEKIQSDTNHNVVQEN